MSVDSGLFYNGGRPKIGRALTSILLALLLYAFFAADAFADVLTLPNSLAVIGEEAFCEDGSLDQVVLPEHIQKIGARAFANSSITSINLPESIEEIGDGAFSNCPNLVAYVKFGSDAYIWCKDHHVTCIADGEIPEGVQYTVDETGIVITGYTGQSSVVDLPDYAGELPVYKIASYAFQNKSITGIRLPSVLKEIGTYAFYNCTGLTELNIPDGIDSVEESAFEGCNGLTAVQMPVDTPQSVFSSVITNVQTIHYTPGKTGIQEDRTAYDGAGSGSYRLSLEYYSLGSLQTVIYDEGITHVGARTFYTYTGSSYMNSALRNVQLPSTLESIGEYAFSHCALLTEIDLPSGMTSLGCGCFEYTGLTQIAFPGSITVIPEYCFQNCIALADVSFHTGLKEIRSSAFYNCTSLTELIIPDGIDSVGGSAFGGCNGLTTVQMPVDTPRGVFSSVSTKVETIHYTPGKTGVQEDRTDGSGGYRLSLEYYSLGSLHTVIYDEGITHVGARTFITFSGSSYINSALRNVQLPSTLESIGEYAFSHCALLTEIDLPNGMTSLGSGCFATTGLTQIAFPSSITVIPAYCFYNCTALADVSFHTGLKEIGTYAFYNCTSLTSVVLPGSVETIGDYAFYGCSSLQFIDIPAGVDTTNIGVSSDKIISSSTSSVPSVIRSVSTTRTDEATLFNIFIEPFDGDITYTLYASSTRYGTFEEVSQGGVELFGCKVLRHGIRAGEPVFYRIYGNSHWTDVFSPYDISLGFRYEQVTYSTVRVIGVYSGNTLTEINVPDMIDGMRVTEIATDAFTPFNKVQKISLPSALADYADTLAKPNADTVIEVRDPLPAIIDHIEILPSTDSDVNAFHVYIDPLTGDDLTTYDYALFWCETEDGAYQLAVETLNSSGCFVFARPAGTGVYFRVRITEKVAGFPVSVQFSESVFAYDENYNEVTYRALLIGLNDYSDFNNWQEEHSISIRCPETNIAENDCLLIRAVLESVDEPYRIRSYLDITKPEILGHIGEMSALADENDVTLIYFIAHGDDKENHADQRAGRIIIGKLPENIHDESVYRVPVGTEDDSLYKDPYDEMYYELSALRQDLDNIAGRKILILGSCGSGAALEDPAFESFDAGNFQTSDYIVFTAVSEYLPAYNSNFDLWYGGHASYFEIAIAEGIEFSGRMPADSDGDGFLTVQELIDYLNARPTLWRQSPQSWSSDPYNDVLFTRKGE